MEISIKEGIENKTELVVTLKDTAKTYGSGMIEVFATPAMIALMEQTAHTSIGLFLPEDYTTVGVEINAKHMKATLVGMKVRCESKLILVDGRRLVFEIKAWDEKGQIGEAQHTRFIIETKKFMDKIS